jgi:hypothetical protein
VWKKVGLKATSIEDTRDEAQEELQKEGAGARKKSRMLKARENINNAMWVEAIPNESAKDMASTLDSTGKHSFSIKVPVQLLTLSRGTIGEPQHSSGACHGRLKCRS